MAAAPRLLTIPISHYCEKARWALEWAGVPYAEEAHLQVFHYLPAWRAGGGRTVPILVHSGGVLTDSADIVRWADERAPAGRRLFPAGQRERAEVEALAARFDAELGPAGRLWVYHHLLEEAPEMAPRYAATGVPAWERRLLRPAFPLVKLVLKQVLGIGQRSAADARDRSLRELDRVAERIADGRPYLAGARFSAADLTFAALCAPLLMTPGYGVPLPAIEELPVPFAGAVAAFREHPAGRFALGLYALHRRP